MITFKELRITPDGQYLIIDAAIDNNDYFSDVYIDSVVIDTQNTYTINGPSSSHVYEYTSIGNQKEVRLTLTSKDLTSMDRLCGNIFFVYVISKGTPSSQAPAGLTGTQIMGTVVSLRPIYKQALCYIKQVENKCDIPKNFVDFILRWKAFELAIRTGNYTLAIQYWNDLILEPPTITLNTNCSCNG